MKPQKLKPSFLERLRAKRTLRGVMLGVAWYTPETWARICETATDRDRLEPTYDEWVQMAEKSLRNMADAGIIPFKVMIDADEFFAWCQSHEKQNDGGSRAQFASFKMHQAHASRTRP